MHISSSLSDTVIDDRQSLALSVKPFQTPLGSNITNLRVPQVNGNTATAVYLGRQMRTCRDGKGRWILGFHIPTRVCSKHYGTWTAKYMGGYGEWIMRFLSPHTNPDDRRIETNGKPSSTCWSRSPAGKPCSTRVSSPSHMVNMEMCDAIAPLPETPTNADVH